MTPFFVLIAIQAVLGALDNLWHHEISERLPARKAASTELSLHAARELAYAFILFGLAWYEWRGGWAIAIAAVLSLEVAITLVDFVVEDRTRRLPPSERVLHTVLAVNYGVALAAIAPVLVEWWSMPAEIARVEHGPVAWLLTLFAAGALAWSVRNAAAVLRHRRPAQWVRDPISPRSSAEPCNVLISGATGFIGGHLVRRLVERGDSVTVLTRDAALALERFGPHVRIVTDTRQIAADERIDAIVNLAGARILGLPWTRRRRHTLVASRVRVTRALVSLCARLRTTPRVFVTGSAIGFYGVRGDERVDERGGPQRIFQSELCRQWEEAAGGAESLGVRLVVLRTGVVLGRDGGALPQLARPVRLGLGAVLGSGKQWVSWVHVSDVARLICFALDTPTLRGPLNAVSPHPVTQRQLETALARSMRRRIRLKVPAGCVRAALGEMAQLLVDGQRVLPTAALVAGFQFRHANLKLALDDLVGCEVHAADTELTELYYNGDCPICRAEMNHYARICTAMAPALEFIDASRRPDALAECRLLPNHLERRVYLRDASGRVTSGLPALIELWSRMPGYRWLARVARMPLLEHAFAALYDLAVAPTLARWARSAARGRERAA